MTWDRPTWHAEANCGPGGELGRDASVRIAIMFPLTPAGHARAVEVCSRCDVRAECRSSGQMPRITRAVKPRWCEECGGEFTSPTGRLTCSDGCATEQMRRKARERSRKVRRGSVCDICGSPRIHDEGCPVIAMDRRRAAVA